jgi:hypothetical protein
MVIVDDEEEKRDSEPQDFTFRFQGDHTYASASTSANTSPAAGLNTYANADFEQQSTQVRNQALIDEQSRNGIDFSKCVSEVEVVGPQP